MSIVRSPLTLRDAGVEQWQVYADELLASPDTEARLRGELIRLELELENADPDARPRLLARERELLRREPSLGGPDAQLARLDATWRRGFISSVRGPTLEALRVLLEQPSGALLDELRLNHPTAPLDAQVDLVARSKAPLRVLEVDSDNGGARFEGLAECGAVLRRESLQRASFVLRRLGLLVPGRLVSHVRALTLAALQLPWVQLDQWTFPELVELELAAITGVTVFWRPAATAQPGLGGGNEAPPPPPLHGGAQLASRAVTPTLRRLVLRNFELEGAGLELLTRLSFAVPLERLDVRGCHLSPSAVDRLRGLKCELLC